MSRSSPPPKQPPRTKDYVFAGGKYKGFTVAEVLDLNAGYILWLQANTDMDFDHTVIEAAEEMPIQT